MISKSQIVTIVCFLGLFTILHFGCDTKSKEHKAIEKSRAQNFEHISISRIITEATEKLPGNAKTALMQMQQQLKNAYSDTTKVSIHKSMASLWYSHKEPLISGHHAEQIALLVNDAQSWNMAGTTYALASQNAKEDLNRQHARKKSKEALENVLSIDPNNIEAKINLALSYVESEAPMQGIMMLKDLNEQYPDNVPVLMQLGKLSIRSGQFQKAVDRLGKVTELRPSFREAHCLLVDVYAQLGEKELSNKEKALCEIN